MIFKSKNRLINLSGGLSWVSAGLITILSACSPSPEVEWSSEGGVILTCPEGWEVTEDHQNEIGGRYLQLEEESFDSSGLMIFNWTDGLFDRQAFLEGSAEPFISSFQDMTLVSDVRFEGPEEVSFGRYPSLSMGYSFEAVGIEHRGHLFVITSCEKTFLVIKQEALEDSAKNAAGFELIEASFRCGE